MTKNDTRFLKNKLKHFFFKNEPATGVSRPLRIQIRNPMLGHNNSLWAAKQHILRYLPLGVMERTLSLI